MKENLIGACSLPFDQFGFKADFGDGPARRDDLDFGDFAGIIRQIERLADQSLDFESEEAGRRRIGEQDDGVISDDECRRFVRIKSLQER